MLWNWALWSSACYEQNHLLGLHGVESENGGFQGRQWASGDPQGEFVEEGDEEELNVSTMRGKTGSKTNRGIR